MGILSGGDGGVVVCCGGGRWDIVIRYGEVVFSGKYSSFHVVDALTMVEVVFVFIFWKVIYGCRYSETFSLDFLYSHLEGKRKLLDLSIQKSLWGVLIWLRIVISKSHLLVSNEQIQKCNIFIIDIDIHNIKDKIDNFWVQIRSDMVMGELTISL